MEKSESPGRNTFLQGLGNNILVQQQVSLPSHLQKSMSYACI